MKRIALTLAFLTTSALGAEQPPAPEEVIARQSGVIQELSAQHTGALNRALQLAAENAALQAKLKLLEDTRKK